MIQCPLRSHVTFSSPRSRESSLHNFTYNCFFQGLFQEVEERVKVRKNGLSCMRNFLWFFVIDNTKFDPACLFENLGQEELGCIYSLQRQESPKKAVDKMQKKPPAGNFLYYP